MPVLFEAEDEYQAEAMKVIAACRDLDRETLINFVNYSHVPARLAGFYRSFLTVYGISGTYIILSYARLAVRAELEGGDNA